MIPTRSTPIQRSWLRTLVWMLVTLVLFGLAGLMGYWAHYLYAVLLFFFGLLAIVGIRSDAYKTDCPVCGARLSGLAGLTCCPKCFSYGKVIQGAYYELEPNFVNAVPTFVLWIGEKRELPPLCCACGNPASRTVRLRIIRLEFAFDLDVPHCESHTGGADLVSQSASGKPKTEVPVLKVQSYAFYRAYMKANYPHTVRW